MTLGGIPIEEVLSVLRENNGNAAATAREFGFRDTWFQRQMRHGKHAALFKEEFPERKKKKAVHSGYKNGITVNCRKDGCNNTVFISIVPGTDPENYDKRRYCRPCKAGHTDAYHTEFRDMTECWA